MSAARETAFVTGAAKGIGKGIVERLAAEGYRVVAVDRLEAVHEVAAALRAAGHDVESRPSTSATARRSLRSWSATRHSTSSSTTPPSPVRTVSRS